MKKDHIKMPKIKPLGTSFFYIKYDESKGLRVLATASLAVLSHNKNTDVYSYFDGAGTRFEDADIYKTFDEALDALRTQ